jgi:hypothetical protein
MDYVEMNKKYLINVEISCNEKPSTIDPESFIYIQSDLLKRISIMYDSYLVKDTNEYAYQICDLITKLIRLGLMSGLPMTDLLDELHDTNLDDKPTNIGREYPGHKLDVHEGHLKPTPVFESIIRNLISSVRFNRSSV